MVGKLSIPMLDLESDGSKEFCEAAPSPDVFSCKAFDVEAALGICKKYFKPTQANIHNMDRGFHQANQAHVKNFTKEGRNACAA